MSLCKKSGILDLQGARFCCFWYMVLGLRFSSFGVGQSGDKLFFWVLEDSEAAGSSFCVF